MADRSLAFDDNQPPFTVELTGLTVHGAPPFEAFEAFAKMLRKLEQGIQFAVGDALRYGEERYGEQASQAFDASDGWSEQTLKVYRWTAEKVPPENRRDDVTFAHHMAVAACGSRTQRSYLKKAAEGGWSVARLKSALREEVELEPVAWLLIIEQPSAKRRDALKEKLEREGVSCTAAERKKAKKN